VSFEYENEKPTPIGMAASNAKKMLRMLDGLYYA
jgi:hypothetical protein